MNCITFTDNRRNYNILKPQTSFWQFIYSVWISQTVVCWWENIRFIQTWSDMKQVASCYIIASQGRKDKKRQLTWLPPRRFDSPRPSFHFRLSHFSVSPLPPQPPTFSFVFFPNLMRQIITSLCTVNEEVVSEVVHLLLEQRCQQQLACFFPDLTSCLAKTTQKHK